MYDDIYKDNKLHNSEQNCIRYFNECRLYLEIFNMVICICVFYWVEGF